MYYKRHFALILTLPLIFNIPTFNMRGLVGVKMNDNEQTISFMNNKERYKVLADEAKRIKEERLEAERLAEIEKLRQLEEARIAEEQRKKYTEVEFILTFFTTLPQENGGYTTTAWGEPLRYGIVASNYYSKDTKMYFEGWGEFVVADRGGSNFNVYNRLDVLIEREAGENDYQYLKRVNNMGKVKVKGYIYN